MSTSSLPGNISDLPREKHLEYEMLIIQKGTSIAMQ